MINNLYHKSFISLNDYDKDTIYDILNLAHALKAKRKEKRKGSSLDGKHIALLFEKNSTRTRCAFEAAIVEEGGIVSFINAKVSQFGKKESAEDSAKVLGCYYDAISFRGHSQQFAYDLAKHSGVPVYNALTDDDHPTQILADLMTIQEATPNKPLNELKIVYVGDTKNNMVHAWMSAAAKIGFHFVAYGPKELHPDYELVKELNSEAETHGGKIEISDDNNCLANADAIYTDVWVSMGENCDVAYKVALLRKYKVTTQMLEQTNNQNVIFMHCLPAFHNLETELAIEYANADIDICEVTDEVFRSANSVVFQQAENRLHTIKALLVATLCNE